MARYEEDYSWQSRFWSSGPEDLTSGVGHPIGPEDFRGGYLRGDFAPGYRGAYERARPAPRRKLRRGGSGERHEPLWGGSVYDAEYFRERGWTTPWLPRYDAESGGRMRQVRRRPEQVRAADIMTRDPEVVTPDATVAEAARLMERLDVGIIPVVESHESRRLRGVITDRDIAIRVVARGKAPSTPVADCMSSGAKTVNQHGSVADVLRLMRRERVRRVPVTDREGRLVGIIAQADLAVDYAGFDPRREIEVAETIERISEPARPRR